MNLRTWVPALLVGVTSLIACKSSLPSSQNTYHQSKSTFDINNFLQPQEGQWFGDSTLVLKQNPEGLPDTLRVRTLQVTPNCDTVANPNINYWLDDFGLEPLPQGTPVLSPGTFNILESDPRSAPPKTEIIRAPKEAIVPKLDISI